MLLVAFGSEGPGHCIWCDTDKQETTDVKFADGSFAGPMCDRCFKRAKKHRSRVAAASTPLSPEQIRQLVNALVGEAKKP